MSQTHLWKEDNVQVEDSIIVSATIEQPDRTRQHLWYRVPHEWSSLLSASCDPFVVATILTTMNQSTDLVVHGEVSPSLLQNLADFQAAWSCWRPRQYKPIEITAEVEQEQLGAKSSDSAIATFSGGVDSCFTVFRHRTGLVGKHPRNLKAGLMVHGFDIPLEQNQVFDRAVAKSKTILTSLGMELIPIATNFRQIIKLNWEDVFGTAAASSLMLLQGGYTVGLIASASPYQSMLFPWGSNPVTDPLLSSNAFQLVHDGAGFTRQQKIREIANWPEALQNLRVCWQGEQLDRNCGRCEKCIRTILCFRVVGITNPSCFEQQVTDEQILGMKGIKGSQLAQLEKILQDAKAAQISDSWVKALERCIQQNRQHLAVKAFESKLKEKIRNVRSQFRKLNS